MPQSEDRPRDPATPEVEVLPPARLQPEDWVAEWFQEVHTQLRRMASELGLEGLTRAAQEVDLAYRELYPPQVVRLSTHRGPGERQRILGMLDLVLEGETQGQVPGLGQ